MRDRIRRRCFERLQTASSKREAAAWQRLMRSMDAARISTIHAFCTQLLRKHAVELGLDPQFEVLDAAAAKLLKLETVDDRLRALLLAGKEEVLELAAKRGLERLRNDLAALAGPRADEAIERWIDATPVDVVTRWREFWLWMSFAGRRRLLSCGSFATHPSPRATSSPPAWSSWPRRSTASRPATRQSALICSPRLSSKRA
jgi:ATP-dependent helicase/nuclease subunit A